MRRSSLSACWTCWSCARVAYCDILWWSFMETSRDNGTLATEYDTVSHFNCDCLLLKAAPHGPSGCLVWRGLKCVGLGVNDIPHDVFLRPIPQATAINVSVKRFLILFLTLTYHEKTRSRTQENVWEDKKCSYLTVNGRIQHATSSTYTCRPTQCHNSEYTAVPRRHADTWCSQTHSQSPFYGFGQRR